jgi:hypothetical protein
MIDRHAFENRRELAARHHFDIVSVMDPPDCCHHVESALGLWRGIMFGPWFDDVVAVEQETAKQIAFLFESKSIVTGVGCVICAPWGCAVRANHCAEEDPSFPCEIVFVERVVRHARQKSDRDRLEDRR